VRWEEVNVSAVAEDFGDVVFDDAVVGLRVVENGLGCDAPGFGVDVDAFACLSGRERDDAMMGVEREIRRLMARRAEMVRRVEVSKSYMDDGHLSARGWLAAVTNSTSESASREVRLGRMLAEMPLLAAAYERGDVGPDQLRVLARLHGNARCRSKMADSDGLLTGHAIRLHVDDFTIVARRWMAWADPDGRDPEKAHRNRDANISPVGAGFSLRARGGGVDGEVMAEVFAQFVEAERLTDVEARRVEFGDDATNHPLPRTAAQRRADALMQMVLKSADVINPTSREPLINLFCTPDELAAAMRSHVDRDSCVPDWFAHPETDEPGEDGCDHLNTDPSDDADPTPTDMTVNTEREFAAGDDVTAAGYDPDGHTDSSEATGGAPEPDDRRAGTTEGAASGRSRRGAGSKASTDPPLPSAGTWPHMNGRGRLCETAGGAPVDHLTLLIAALTGRIRRVVIDSTGRVVDLGRKQRLFTGAIREAILLASDRCCWPGCDIRGPGVQVDHLTEHHAGGHTSVFNGGPMCPLHNRFKYRHRVTVYRDATGWHFLRTDGTEIAPRPVVDPAQDRVDITCPCS
jgi:hypothetical protein